MKRKESPQELKARARKIVRRLERAYPGATCALHHTNALELLVATILSAQCTDVRVNKVTPALFAKYRSARDYASADPRVLEREIQSTGFFRNKTKSIIGMAQALVERHGGTVPDTMDALVALPGVGRKTANVILGTWFGKNEGVVVDTHVQRITRLLKLTRHDDPVSVFPQDDPARADGVHRAAASVRGVRVERSVPELARVRRRTVGARHQSRRRASRALKGRLG